MKALRCKYVNIRFNKQNYHQQRIDLHTVTCAHYLVVAKDDNDVSIYFCRDEQGKAAVLKTLSFNRTDVLEIECEDIINCVLEL